MEESLKEKLIKCLKQEMPTWKGNLWNLTRRYEEWLTENMTEEIKYILYKEREYSFETLQKAHAGISRSLDIFRNLLEAKG